MTDSAPHAKLLTVIEPTQRWGVLDWQELWRARELLFFFTWRDVPERPLLQGQWWSHTWWLGQMSSSAFNSADRAGVFDTSKRGPRGGARFAVLDMAKWTAWREGYQRRARALEIGHAKMKALRAMGVEKPR
jgi:hypothetical protein